jgi:sulfate transport system ATP-binding protein
MNRGKVEQIGAPSEVYRHPASPFVHGFLGDVNLFHGRLHQGVLETGAGTFDAPEHADAHNAHGIGFLRPHDIEIERYHPDSAGLVVRLRRARALGPLAQLELERQDNAGVIEAVIAIDRFAELNLGKGDPLVIRATRMRVFVDGAAQDKR